MSETKKTSTGGRHICFRKPASILWGQLQGGTSKSKPHNPGISDISIVFREWGRRTVNPHIYEIFSNKTMKHFFLPVNFFQGHWRFKGQKGNGGDHLYSSLPLPSAHKILYIYLGFCIQDDYAAYVHLFFSKTIHFWPLPRKLFKLF